MRDAGVQVRPIWAFRSGGIRTPWAYLRDLFCLVPDWPQTRLLELTPKHWRQTLQHPNAQQRLAANKLRVLSLAAPHGTEAT